METEVKYYVNSKRNQISFKFHKITNFPLNWKFEKQQLYVNILKITAFIIT